MSNYLQCSRDVFTALLLELVKRKHSHQTFVSIEDCSLTIFLSQFVLSAKFFNFSLKSWKSTKQKAFGWNQQQFNSEMLLWCLAGIVIWLPHSAQRFRLPSETPAPKMHLREVCHNALQHPSFKRGNAHRLWGVRKSWSQSAGSVLSHSHKWIPEANNPHKVS